jgi:hypothetical protein
MVLQCATRIFQFPVTKTGIILNNPGSNIRGLALPVSNNQYFKENSGAMYKKNLKKK